MKTICSILLLTLIAAVTAYGSSKPADVDGWDGVRWGMTDEEVKAAFGSEARIMEPREDAKEGLYSNILLSSVKLGGQEFRASLWMDSDTKKLKKIVFVPKEQPEGYEWAETFIKLEESLVGKYGAPDVEETSNDPGTSAERKWVFPSTLIEMSYLRIQDTELLLLVFSDNEKARK